LGTRIRSGPTAGGMMAGHVTAIWDRRSIIMGRVLTSNLLKLVPSKTF
jgi:hypothetical protein